MEVQQIDPALRQELLLRTGSTSGLVEQELAGESELPVIARLDLADVEVPGLRVVSRFGPIVTGRVRPVDVLAVRRHHRVRSLKLSRSYSADLALSVPEVRARRQDLAQGAPTAGSGLTGAGVLVLVLDWGLDIAHANFRNPDGTTRVEAMWDQRGGPTPTSPQPFGYGRVITRADIDRALGTPDPYAALGYDPADADPRAEGTHGTHVGDIAAGNGRAPGSAPGMAPGAGLLFAHLRGDDTRASDTLGDSSRLLEALDWGLRMAAGRPLVANFSVGRNGGPHDDTPLVVRALDHLLDTVAGVAVAMSCGNYHDSRMHAQLQVLPGKHSQLTWQVPGGRDQPAELEIWYAADEDLPVALVDPSGRVLAEVPLGGEAVVHGAGVGQEGELIASLFHRRGDPNSGDNVIDIFLQPSAPAGDYLVRLHGRLVRDGTAECWIERTAASSQSRFPAHQASPASTTGTICGGRLPLAVGAYDARDPAGPILPFSSAGPTRDGRTKPDISAPGGGVVAARSSVPLPAGGRRGDGLVAKSGTSMAAPHVTGAIALLFEAAAPRRLPMSITRWVLQESARRSQTGQDPLRFGAGRLDAAGACRLVRGLLVAREEPLTPVGATSNSHHVQHAGPVRQEAGTTMTISETRPDAVLSWLTGGSQAEQADSAEAIVGQLMLSAGQVVPVEPRAPAAGESTLDAAVRAALARTTEHTVITETGRSPAFRVEAFGPSTSLPAPVVAAFDGAANIQVISINGGDRVLLPANPTAPGLRRVDVPGLRSFYALPAADATRLRNIQADRLASVVSGLSRASARSIGVPLMRVTLAANGAAAFPVRSVQRGTPAADVGGVVNGVSLPVLQVPLQEPHCYLPVIAEVEGKLESINAWDLGAGVSLGPIQFNVIRGALFRFLWRLWTDDRDLFTSALTGPLNWTMAAHGDHPDLLVTRAGSVDTLHGRAADAETNARYLQSGVPGGAGRDPAYRRGVAAALRDCVVWPHVQDMIIEVSAWWLTPSLDRIRREGIGPLDPRNPDRDTFILTALLLSASVRFSGCLQPLLEALRRWTTVADKLAHWQDALNTTSARCQGLALRLRSQQGHARTVHDQLRRLTGQAGAGEDLGDAEALDATVAAAVPATTRTTMVQGLTASANSSAQTWNAGKHPSDSGTPGADIASQVLRHISLASATAAATQAGASGGTAPFDARCVEAIHQFQAISFVESGQVDGKAGPSTLDTLGLVRRTGMNPVATANSAAQRRLTARSSRVSTATNSEFTGSNWWEGMVNPGWLGRRFSNGIHLVLARRLRQAEALLLGQQAYAGMTGVRLGAALGITEGHKGARPSSSSASMHTFGLAVDIEYTANPWIVGQHIDGGASSPSPAGEVTRDANRNMTRALNRASLLVRGEVINLTAAYLSRLSSGTAGDAWDDLNRRHTAFRTYLALAGDVTAARAHVDANRAVAGVVQSGESPDDAARRWARWATSDLADLRLGSVTRRNAAGNDESVARSNFTGRDPRLGFLTLHRDLVVALRDGAGLAWGAIDFGTSESGDVMHFDCRRDGVGAVLYPR